MGSVPLDVGHLVAEPGPRMLDLAVQLRQLAHGEGSALPRQFPEGDRFRGGVRPMMERLKWARRTLPGFRAPRAGPIIDGDDATDPKHHEQRNVD